MPWLSHCWAQELLVLVCGVKTVGFAAPKEWTVGGCPLQQQQQRHSRRGVAAFWRLAAEHHVAAKMGDAVPVMRSVTCAACTHSVTARESHMHPYHETGVITVSTVQPLRQPITLVPSQHQKPQACYMCCTNQIRHHTDINMEIITEQRSARSADCCSQPSSPYLLHHSRLPRLDT